MENSSFLDSRAWPVLFMIILSIFFVGLLATMYEYTKADVAAYQTLQQQKSVLDALKIEYTDPEFVFDKMITRHQTDGIAYWEAADQSGILGYCLPLAGTGLWSTIEGLLAVSPDGNTIIGFEITSQAETPGLGGRISEDWFTGQFTGKPLKVDSKPVRFSLVSDQKANPEPTDIVQITGATASSGAVRDMIYKLVAAGTIDKIKGDAR